MTPPRPRPGLRLALALAAALAFAAFYLHVSARVGRLSMDLQYDDVVYAVDAADRLDAAASGGLAGLARSFRDTPPHSIFATLQAMAAFALGGIGDEALYASNAWMLLVLAGLVAAAFRERHGAAFALALAFALTSPLAYHAMAEFRPDIPLGLATALMAGFLLEAALLGPPRRARLAGVMLAAALVVKPTFFAHTLAIAVALAAATWLAGRWAPRARFALPGREAALFLGIGLAVALPFYLVNGTEAAGYFWTHTFGAKGHVWTAPGVESPWRLLALFWPSMFWLSRYDLWVGALGALALAACLAGHRQERDALGIVGLLTVALMSVAIVVAGRQDSPYFFATMHWLVLFAALHGYARFEGVASATGRIAGRAVLGVAIVALAIANSAVPAQAFPAESVHGKSWNERAVRLIRDDIARGEPPGALPPASIYVPSAGVVNVASMRWVGRSLGQPLLEAPAHVLEGLDEAKRDAVQADYLVIPNVALVNSDGWLPIGPARAPLLEWLRADGRFRALGATDPTQAYYVFANAPRTARFHARPGERAPTAPST